MFEVRQCDRSDSDAVNPSAGGAERLLDYHEAVKNSLITVVKIQLMFLFKCRCLFYFRRVTDGRGHGLNGQCEATLKRFRPGLLVNASEAHVGQTPPVTDCLNHFVASLCVVPETQEEV